MQELTKEEFNSFIEDNDLKIINEVAFAYGCANAQGVHKHFKAFGHYPKEYIVTKEQINTAKRIRTQKQKEAIKEHRKNNSLVFIGMGMTFEAKEGFINNHRIRASFINDEGIMCFIEVGALAKDKSLMRCDHSIFNNLKDWNNLLERDAQEKNNYANLERSISIKYTYENLLNIVNKNFNCSFENILVDEFLLTTDLYAGISPQVKK